MNEITKNKQKILLLIFSLCFSGSLASGYFFDKVDLFSKMDKLEILLFASFWFMMTVAVYLFVLLVKRISIAIAEPEQYDKSKSIRIGIISFTIIFFFYTIVWLAYYPGLFNYDPWQVEQVMNNKYNCFHPLIHTLLLGNCYKFGQMIGNCNIGIVIYDFIQLFILSFSFSIAISMTCIEYSKKYILILIYALFPVYSIMGISSTKDTIYSALVLLCMLFIRHYLTDECNKALYFLGVLLIILMLLFRNNAPYSFVIFLALAAGLCIFKLCSFKKISIFILAFIIFFASDNVMKRSLGAESGSVKEMASVPSVQMVRIYLEKVADKNDLEIIEKYIDLKNVSYDARLADKSKGNLKSVSCTKDLWGLYFNSFILFVKHPVVSLEAFLLLHEGGWYILDVSHSEVYGKGMDARQGYLLTDVKSGYGVSPDSKFPFLENILERLFSNNEYQKNPLLVIFFCPATYNWVYVACLLSLMIKKQKEKLISALLLLGIIFTIFLGPASIVRYYFPVMVCDPVLVYWAVFSEKRKKWHEK